MVDAVASGGQTGSSWPVGLTRYAHTSGPQYLTMNAGSAPSLAHQEPCAPAGVSIKKEETGKDDQHEVMKKKETKKKV